MFNKFFFRLSIHTSAAQIQPDKGGKSLRWEGFVKQVSLRGSERVRELLHESGESTEVRRVTGVTRMWANAEFHHIIRTCRGGIDV